MPQPALRFAPELLLKAQGIKAAIFDVDGVLTDGRLVYSEDGHELKTFHVHDGLGLGIRKCIEAIHVSHELTEIVIAKRLDAGSQSEGVDDGLI